MSPGQYLRFMLVGSMAAATSIACRELLRLTLGDGTTLRYSVSVIVAYASGIITSFLLNRRFTFGGSTDWSTFPRFVMVACVGMISTWTLSLLLRPLFADLLGSQLSGTAAFVVGSLISSVLTYPLNALLVFREQRTK